MADQPDFSELDKLRSVEELANLQALTQREVEALDSEYAGLPMPPETQAAWDAATALHAEIGERIAHLNARKAQLAAMAGDERKVEAPEVVVKPTYTEANIFDPRSWQGQPTVEKRNQALRDNAMRAVEIANIPEVKQKPDEAKHKISEFLDLELNGEQKHKELAERVLTTGSPAYRKDFNRYVASGGEIRGTALAVGVDATGGFAVPFAFDPTIIAIGAHTAINPYRSVCRVVTISGTDTWQALTATAVPAVYAAEAAAATEQGPTFAKPEFVAKRAHSFITASYEMAQDRSDLAAELGVLFGEGKDTNEETQFSIGVGTTVFPQGMGLKDAYTRVDTVTNDVFAVADVRAMEAALPIRHRFNAVWFLSRAAIRAIQAFETTGGQLFGGIQYASVGDPRTDRGGNTGLQLLGYPVYETPSMPFTPTTDDTTWGVLANPQTYVIVDRVGMSIKVIPDMLNGATPSFPTGEIGIYAFWRNTARVLNADGGRQGGIL